MSHFYFPFEFIINLSLTCQDSLELSNLQNKTFTQSIFITHIEKWNSKRCFISAKVTHYKIRKTYLTIHLMLFYSIYLQFSLKKKTFCHPLCDIQILYVIFTIMELENSIILMMNNFASLSGLTYLVEKGLISLLGPIVVRYIYVTSS